jgi:hypothetical protein
MNINLKSLILASVALAIVGCNGNASNIIANHPSAPPGPAQYQQVERLARPAIKEAFENWQNHDQTNRSAPTNDTELQNSVSTFMTSAGGANRSAAIANFVSTVLFPDELAADLSKTVAGCGTANAPCGAYLGVETGGATGNKFGGRWLNDDTIKTSLGIIFGPTVPALSAGAIPDDNKESWCLTDHNLSSGEGTFQSYSATFPYVNTPY